MAQRINPQVIRPGIMFKRGKAEVVPGQGGNGMTVFEKKKVSRLIVPTGDRARDRLIRLHEVLHANNSSSEQEQAKKFKVSELTCQAVEDGYVHLMYWPRVSKSMERDAVAVALQDLRNLHRQKEDINDKDNILAYNVALAHSLRSMAMVKQAVQRLGNTDNISFADVESMKLIKDTFENAGMAKALWKVLWLIAQGKKRRKQALELFESLLKQEPGDGQINPHDANDEEIPEDGKGKQTKEPMRVVELSRTERTDNESPEWCPSRSGSRIIVSRLPHVLATRNLMGLFEKEQFTPNRGTVLIDGSGSMGVCNEVLTQLCKLAPGATVAFYTGYGLQAEGHYGDLVVFAKDGQRAEIIPPEIRVGCGNEVDFFALQWLLKQQGPLTFVTDEQFGGGPSCQGTMAKTLLDVNRQSIQVYHFIREALEVFQVMK